MADLAKAVGERFDEFLMLLTEFLRFRSVSADAACREEVYRSARWVQQYVGRLLGCAELNDGYGLPLVYGQGPCVAGRPTVLLYGHHDVQPAVREDGWRTEPFEPTVADGYVVGRGASDNKGPLLTYLCAIDLLKSLGPLPVNVKVLVEGEEESSGHSLASFVEANRDRLACDLLISTDAGGFLPDLPAITYGTRGLVYKQIDVCGPKRDLHSGTFGGFVPNPAQALARLIADLVGPEGKINVPGLYDRVRPIDPDEHEQFSRLEYKPEYVRQMLGIKELVGEPEFGPLERLWCRPHLSVNGLVGGYTGPGAKTVLPAKASAKLSVRIVPDQSPAEVSDLLDRAILALADPAVETTVQTLGLAESWLGPRTGPQVDAARQAVRTAFGTAPAVVREGGTIPILPLFKRLLTDNILMLGFTRPDCAAHGPNEYYHVDDFRRGIHTVCALMQTLGRQRRMVE